MTCQHYSPETYNERRIRVNAGVVARKLADHYGAVRLKPIHCECGRLAMGDAGYRCTRETGDGMVSEICITLRDMAREVDAYTAKLSMMPVWNGPDASGDESEENDRKQDAAYRRETGWHQ